MALMYPLSLEKNIKQEHHLPFKGRLAIGYCKGDWLKVDNMLRSLGVCGRGEKREFASSYLTSLFVSLKNTLESQFVPFPFCENKATCVRV